MKKSREEIKKAILDALEQKPLSIQQISEKAESNWSTINDVSEELKKEGKVRELIATDKIKIFAKKDYPVFYGIPLDEKIINDSLALMKIIATEWKSEKKTNPPLTTVQKIAVDVVEDCKLNLPVIEFHYGKVIPIIFDMGNKVKDIDVKKLRDNSKILECIRKEILKHSEIAWRERNNQYKRYNMSLFQIKEEIQLIFKGKNIKDMDLERLNRKIIEFALKYPVYEEEVYNLFSRFENSSVLLLETKSSEEKIKDYLQAIQTSFEKIWDLTTSYLFFKGVKKFVSRENLRIFDLIKDMQINFKINCAESVIGIFLKF